MTNKEIYKEAILELSEKTFKRFEHDEEKAIELFDKLLDKGIKSHCDTVKRFCKEAGYGEYESEAIANIYDIIDLYKAHKKQECQHWDISALINP